MGGSGEGQPAPHSVGGPVQGARNPNFRLKSDWQKATIIKAASGMHETVTKPTNLEFNTSKRLPCNATFDECPFFSVKLTHVPILSPCKDKVTPQFYISYQYPINHNSMVTVSSKSD